MAKKKSESDTMLAVLRRIAATLESIEAHLVLIDTSSIETKLDEIAKALQRGRS